MRKILLPILSGMVVTPVIAQPAAPAPTSGLPVDINIILVLFAAFLLVPIYVLSNTFLAAARRYYQDRIGSDRLKSLLIPGLMLLSASVLAQTAEDGTSGFNSQSMTLFLIGLIALEFLVLLFFAYKTNVFIRKAEVRQAPVVTERISPWTWLVRKFTDMSFKPIEEEANLDTGHSYDGIRELDNPIPAWFTTAFLITIAFAAVYMYRYHIAKSAPLQLEELKIAMAKADLEHEAYLAKAASGIDESNVALMTGADLEAGQKVFVTLCAACHKPDGSGLVGPNLTDNYWIHGGSLQDIFKVVKYGVPDKGMISWKEQLTPVQMAQVSNYILTLVGTNPPDPKEKQGELYVPKEAEPAAPADTSAVIN